MTSATGDDSVVDLRTTTGTDRLDATAADRLREQVSRVRTDPTSIRSLFPAAARTVARDPVGDGDALVGPAPRQDVVRGALLTALAEALADDPDALAREVADLYRYGDADEKRAVLRSLPLPGIGTAALPLVQDALRTNDVRLVAVALGEYGAEHLDDDAWRQGVLKCLFVGVPLAAVARLHARADDELARMTAAFAYERVLAGRLAPDDVQLVLGDRPDAVRSSGLLEQLDSPQPERRSAAEALMSAVARQGDPS